MDLEAKGFIETSFLDWDGKVVSVVFLPFCNFRCPFCHNAGLIENPDSYETVPASKILDFVMTHRDFIDGVCFTGGEPSLHKGRGLKEFMGKLKEEGFKVKLDTNGTDPGLIAELIDEKLVDFIAMDVKGPLDDRYEKLSGVRTDISSIRRSIETIIKSGIDHEFRTTVVPGLLNIKDIEDVAKELKGAKRLVLQQFVPKNTWDESLRGRDPLPLERMEAKLALCRKYVPDTIIRGV